MPTMKELRQKKADSFHAEQIALVSVLRKRMQWHHEQLQGTLSKDEQKWHEELFHRDEDLLQDAKERYEAIGAKYTSRRLGGIELPYIDFSAEISPS